MFGWGVKRDPRQPSNSSLGLELETLEKSSPHPVRLGLRMGTWMVGKAPDEEGDTKGLGEEGIDGVPAHGAWNPPPVRPAP